MIPDQLQRVESVWRRFIGMFGGDAVKRKYGDAIPPEWPAVLAKLSAQHLDRGMRRLVHSGRDSVPSLPAFVRLCEHLGDDPLENAGSVATLPSGATSALDEWDCVANLHLLAHMRRRISKGGRPFGAPGVYLGHGLSASPETSREMHWCVARLAKAKNDWVSDMREIADPDNRVDGHIQRQCWNDYIGAAERDIHAYMLQVAA